MKKIYAAIAALVVIIVGAFAFNSTQSKAHTTATPKHVTVGVLQLMRHPALDQINDGITKGLADGGFHKGKNLTIKYSNAEADQSNLKSMSDKFISEKTDLTFGIATPAAMALANAANGKSPVILAGITDPAGSGLIKSESKPGANITGTSGEAPLEKDLSVIKAIKPHAKRIGIIYSPSDHGGDYNAKKFAKIVTKAGLKYKLYTISNTNDVEQVAGQMVQECDIIYAPQDNLVASSMKTLVGVANGAKVAVIPAADTMVKDGGLAAYAINQFNLGRVAGQMAAKVLKGKKTSDYAVKHITKGEYVINTKEAKILGIKIPDNIVKAANKDGEVFK
ncbi:tryptophan ABC transporter substrate-binding protein [Lacticaseibacillus zhaodongensis]|uniref:tryptophan ABC transporter substrate-binding protein n=1 Tax=Lacticaseibacillus zhaodongensis TaxID=2668065 RepID=UPI0012D3023D|nr:tryptophan ABC transporter substrate-binding protein [Lacticaseibacillus zhaodongensis]